ncbi:DnaJ-class molecular chaperone with C-terminal Zn finger domain protein [Rubidibacter lacunae KORDI 51-2]|uniref:DnaJ-class molecular chaperone with C-terminal Zn finger domain protein n=1 Tax=Rubidibacter lacunae KORDI 51-2 TaxID=582515 RepID=U5DQ90_9CHRO|nr:J domain-containing protein [Rubidibacter lacunae]ERN41860.1 DnaJ-class molecular chaperone with C-terminal Zn finger domain protein [Rubidibacter lacunae KORDI 51-2]
MQNFRNYYAILNLAPDVKPNDIKAAYRRLARQYHPDLNPGDKASEERFKDIVEAYDVLGDPTKREQYDDLRDWHQQNRPMRAGRNGRSTNGQRNGKSRTNGSSPYGGDFNRFTEQVLGRRGTRVRSDTRSEEQRRVPVDETDPFRPGTTKKAYKVRAPGSPTTHERARDVEARLSLPLEKAYRGGRERIRLEDGRSLEVDMPPGMTGGQQMRLRGQGLFGGDLYLNIDIQPHPFFELDGIDVFCQVPIAPSEAVLGGAVEVPTLDGLVKMSIPPGVASGKRLKLANKGYISEDGDRGDQLVEIQIAVPQELTAEERDLYEQLRRLETFDPRKDAFGL